MPLQSLLDFPKNCNGFKNHHRLHDPSRTGNLHRVYLRLKLSENCQNHSLIITRRTGNLHHFNKCLFEVKY